MDYKTGAMVAGGAALMYLMWEHGRMRNDLSEMEKYIIGTYDAIATATGRATSPQSEPVPTQQRETYPAADPFDDDVYPPPGAPAQMRMANAPPRNLPQGSGRVPQGPPRSHAQQQQQDPRPPPMSMARAAPAAPPPPPAAAPPRSIPPSKSGMPGSLPVSMGGANEDDLLGDMEGGPILTRR
jgi:hypothetical protein